eukprot:CAMPEP_0118902576 /NCGR_PEP_ID=MMETSP1166-20130328/7800_1 /TAXON_ID=1104430 /ORGANISM="Chrysoreinhardia sp, Strain CCMP3193" /LENGTH=349 /DNA_ID=CAMNT_0006841785 /DNA_START=27 /DNA_END=1077 /DNA_ORIENTATION=-
MAAGGGGGAGPEVVCWPPGGAEGGVPDALQRPEWFRAPAPAGERYERLRESLKSLELHTVCDEAACPNVGECWNGGTATIMLLGDTCTRGCQFCNVKTSATPGPPDEDEPLKAAAAVANWDVDYVVLTSVDRDDLPDGGAAHFARTVALFKELRPSLLVECLVSDFAGDLDAVDALATSGLDVYAHNLETVRRLTPRVRDKRANYDQSLKCLARAKEGRRAARNDDDDDDDPKGGRKKKNLVTKSSLMLGLGETRDEVRRAMDDLRSHGVDVLTLGQYLRPTERHLSVVEYVRPEVFDDLREVGEAEFGFAYVASGPLVRSSYKAGEFFIANFIDEQRKKQATPKTQAF